MTGEVETGVTGYLVFGTRPIDPCGERIAGMARKVGDVGFDDLMAPMTKSVDSLGRQSAGRHWTLGRAGRLLAEKHREAGRSKPRSRRERKP